MNDIFQGLKVIDVSQVAAAPMTARMLGDFGADVIHVEHPETGDIFRHVLAGMQTGVQAEFNYVFEHYNRNKKSLTLDIKTPEGQAILHRLMETADVFITNLRPYEQEKYHLKYETLKEINPRLIGAYLCGFGTRGPEKDIPAYDHTAFWARSGIPHRLKSLSPALQNPETPTPAFIPSFGDHMTGLSLVSGIFLALYDRERTGLGREVTASLFQTAVHQISWDIAATLTTGEDCPMIDPDELVLNPLYRQYRTKGDRWILFCALNPARYLGQVLTALGREELIEDPRFDLSTGVMEDHVALRNIIQDELLSKTLDEWRPILDAAGVPYSPLQNLPEVTKDVQALENGFFEDFDHPEFGPVKYVANPINVGDDVKGPRIPAPEFGQHTEEVLLDVGYDWDEIVALREKGVIA